MEDGDTEKYHPNRVIQDFVFLSPKRCCIRCISLQVYNKLQTLMKCILMRLFICVFTQYLFKGTVNFFGIFPSVRRLLPISVCDCPLIPVSRTNLP